MLITFSGQIAILSFFILVAVCFRLGYRTVEELFFMVDLLVVTCVMFLFVNLHYKESKFKNRLIRTPFLILGDMSYSLYLTHAPIIHIVWLILCLGDSNKNEQFAILTVCAIPVSLFVGYLFYSIFERPFMSHISNTKR